MNSSRPMHCSARREMENRLAPDRDKRRPCGRRCRRCTAVPGRRNGETNLVCWSGEVVEVVAITGKTKLRSNSLLTFYQTPDGQDGQDGHIQRRGVARLPQAEESAQCTSEKRKPGEAELRLGTKQRTAKQQQETSAQEQPSMARRSKREPAR
jgi:hypothetical protein